MVIFIKILIRIVYLSGVCVLGRGGGGGREGEGGRVRGAGGEGRGTAV